MLCHCELWGVGDGGKAAVLPNLSLTEVAFLPILLAEGSSFQAQMGLVLTHRLSFRSPDDSIFTSGCKPHVLLVGR